MARLDTVAVVGASLAGLRGVEALRARGFDGRIHWIGAEAHEPYDRPPLSKEVLRGEWNADRIRLRRQGLADLATELHLGRRALALDLDARRLELDGGETLGFDGLFIATGASALPLPGTPPLEGVHLLRTLEDALSIRSALERTPRVAVVGGGFIGAEVAASCRQRGLEVTLIEALEQPLAQSLGPELGAWCASLHRDHGVDLRLGARVAALEGGARVERVRLADGSAVRADLVVVGIGVRPNTQWLEGSGLELENGVLCDARCAAAADVVAAGDVARWRSARYGGLRIEHWDHAVNQAEAAAARLLDGPEAAAPFDPVPFVWSDQYDAKIQLAGLPRAGDELHWIDGSPDERRFVVLTGRDGRWTGVVAANRAARFIRWRRELETGLPLEAALAQARSK